MRRSYMSDRFWQGNESHGDNDASVQSQPRLEPRSRNEGNRGIARGSETLMASGAPDRLMISRSVWVSSDK